VEDVEVEHLGEAAVQRVVSLATGERGRDRRGDQENQ
jgi:hypothetical protein